MTTTNGVGAFPLRYTLVDRHTVLPLSYKAGVNQYNRTSPDFANVLNDWFFTEEASVPQTHEGACSFDCESITEQNGESISPSSSVEFVIDSVLNSILSTNSFGSTVFPCEAGIKPTTKTVTRADLTTTTANETTYTSNSFTPVADDWLLVFVLAGSSDGDVVSLTDSQGIGFTEITNEGIGGTHAMFVFKANNVASPTPMTVTFNCEGATGCAMYVARVGGTNRNVVQYYNTSSGVSTINMPYNLNTNNLVFAIAGHDQNPANVDPPARFTELEGVDTGFNTPTLGMAVSYSIEGNSGDSVINWPSSFVSQMAIEIGTLATDATVRYGATALPSESVITSFAAFTHRGEVGFNEEAIISGQAGTMDNTASTLFNEDAITVVRGNLVINSYEAVDAESIITSLGGMALNASHTFIDDSIINSFGGITIAGQSQFDDEANTGVTGNIQFNANKVFVEDGIITTVGNIDYGYIGLRLDQESIIVSAASIEGTSEVNGSASYDLESIITSAGSIEFNNVLTFEQRLIISNTGSFIFDSSPHFGLEGNTSANGSILFSTNLNVLEAETQIGNSASIIFNPYESYIGESNIGVTGNISMANSQAFESEIQIFPDGTTSTISIISGAVEILLEGQAAQTGNITLGQPISFNNEVILTNIYSVDIGVSVVFPIESITDISSTAVMGGMVVFPIEVQLTTTNENAVTGAVVILLESQLTADGLRQMVSNQFSITTNLTRAFHVELTIPDLEIILNHQSPIEVDLTINRTFPVELTINMGRSI